ncbi:hypothetical protein AVI51_03175 [Piscirickettsia salmonis]|uniref:hypothetical protein n=1 Tax=Piscirickettsia salmonis TaxID=1238 RepID=UPI0006BC796A|nr:hypothetical protein [Piscirickettsia salmonis]ALA25072.1 lactate dehydrogenase [Piscirickettsia salmonis]APS45353.1 hypothetical protein AVI48_13890 [Piscirickettsia salmonis]APS48713.1 hypothetical protein AVI49_14500 [Piscirickettsia salmonis]APS49956.1 hypothetical protein AVI50_03215 [Piscirickettsia salmonis]APS53149.1 hypothetical protein AVI51_03175 [Piscirickettsia salmonis]
MNVEKFLEDNIKRLNYYGNIKKKGKPRMGDTAELQISRRAYADDMATKLRDVLYQIRNVRGGSQAEVEFKQMVILLPILKESQGLIEAAEVRFDFLKGLRGVLNKFKSDCNRFTKKITLEHERVFDRSLREHFSQFNTTEVVRSSFDTAQKGQETIDLSDQLDHGRDEGYAL